MSLLYRFYFVVQNSHLYPDLFKMEEGNVEKSRKELGKKKEDRKKERGKGKGGREMDNGVKERRKGKKREEE
jgi:hypothetical protein